jgi:aspartyl/asparaginyl-tRNA synthetase
LHALISQYEKKEDEESKFVYAMDKIIPDMNNILSGGVTYKKHDETLEMLDSYGGEKTKIHPFVHGLWKEIRVMLVEKHDELFPKEYTTPL